MSPGLAVALIAFAMAATWAFITPPFDAPDEPEHFAYTQYLAETGNPPDRTPGGRPDPLSTEQVIAVEAVRLYSHIAAAEGRPPWLAEDERRWRERQESENPARDNGGSYTVSAAGHQPAYYALLAPAYLLGQDASPWTRLTLMRLVSALLGALTALFAFLTVRELAPRVPLAAVTAGLLVALHPMFGFMSGAVNNDMGVNAAAGALVYLLVRALRRGLTARLAVAIGATLVVMPLLKGTGYALYPAAAFALGVLLWRQRSIADLKPWAALAGVFVACQALWLAVSGALDRTAYATPGGNAPTAQGGVVGAALDHPLTYLSYLWQVFLPRLPFMSDMHIHTLPAFNLYVESGWAAFGWAAKLFPRWVYAGIVATVLLVGALGLRALWLERDRLRARWAEAAVILFAAVGVVAAVHAAYFSPTPRAALAEQGRYIFTAVVPLAVAAVAGTFGLGRRWQPVLAAALVAAVAALTYASRWLALGGFFA